MSPVRAFVGLALIVFWIWALVDAIKVKDDWLFRVGNKVIWVVVIALTGAIGGFIYLLVGRPRPAALP